MRVIIEQNLFTSLPDTAVVFYFYLELQNSKSSKTSWVVPKFICDFLSKIQHYPIHILGVMYEILSHQHLSNPADTVDFII
jgi:hypothetical protein